MTWVVANRAVAFKQTPSLAGGLLGSSFDLVSGPLSFCSVDR